MSRSNCSRCSIIWRRGRRSSRPTARKPRCGFPEIAGGISVALAHTFKAIDPDLHWERVLRILVTHLTVHNRAKELGAELIVMGAYGHSRLRETILGGMTHDMLLETTRPLLMSH
jgi:hypothetical protein